MRRAWARDAPVVVWSLFLALLVLGPGLGPGYLLVRDMVWVPDLALRADFLGLGSGLPRAVPSDAVVAVLDQLVPGMLLQKLVLIAALAAGGVGATRLLVGAAAPGLVVRLVVVTVYGWNALVAERLLMGAWPVLVGYAVLPWLLVEGRRWREEDRLPLLLLVLVPLGCLSASAGLATSVAVLAAAAGRGRTLRAVLLVAAGNAPWWVAGLLHASSATSDSAAAQVFALRGEGSVPGPLAALTLGGIWNTTVQPDSRTSLLGWAALLALVGLAAVGWRSWWRRAPARDRVALLVCWATGWGLAVLTWLLPGAVGWASEHAPRRRSRPGRGARPGALRTSTGRPGGGRGAGAGPARAPRGRRAGGARDRRGAAARRTPPRPRLRGVEPARAGPLPRGVRRGPRAPRRTEQRRARAAAVSYRAPAWNHGRPVLDPAGRYLTPDYVSSDVLVVDGVPLSGEDPRVDTVARALALPTPAQRAAALARDGIGAVVVDETATGDAPEIAGEELLAGPDLRVTLLEDPHERVVPLWWGIAMTLAWLAFMGPWVVALAASVVALRRGREAAGTRQVTGE